MVILEWGHFKKYIFPYKFISKQLRHVSQLEQQISHQKENMVLFIPHLIFGKIITPKIYNISLDINPENRWDDIIEDNADNLQYINKFTYKHRYAYEDNQF